MANLSDTAVRHLDRIAKSLHFTNYRIETEAGSKHGDGYMGLMVSVKIIGDQEIDGVKVENTLQLMCKLAPTNAERRQHFQSAKVFGREALAYNSILPYFAEFQRDRGLSVADGFNAMAKCYAANVDELEEILIMDDMRAKGYAVLAKGSPCIEGNIRLVYEQLAKLHAISFALKDQRPDYYNQLRTDVKDIMVEVLRIGNAKLIFLSSYRRALNTLDDPEQLRILQEMHDGFEELLESCLCNDVFEPYGVIGHGDCWNNNILFKNDQVFCLKYFSKACICIFLRFSFFFQSGNVDRVCFIDWQIMRFSSPVIDLVYNLCGSSDKKFRKTHYPKLLDHYYDTLQWQIRKLGSDPDVLFPYNVFQEHLKRFGRMAFVMAPMFCEVVLANSADVPDLDELSKKMDSGDGESVSLVHNQDEQTKQLYKERLSELLADLIELGYYWK